MKRPARPSHPRPALTETCSRLGRCGGLLALAGLTLGLATSAAMAQAPAAPGARLPVTVVPTAANGTPTYVDRVMDGPLPADDGLELKASDYNAGGWPRSWHIDYSVFSQRGASETRSRAIGLGGFLDTPNHGAWSANANLVEQRLDASGAATKDTASTWRIDQRALPLDGGWRANHAAGDINTGSVPIARGLGRVMLPSTPIRGLGGQWYLADATDLNAAVGRSGVFSGLDLAGFEPTRGRIASLGGQTRLPLGRANGSGGGSRTDAAVQLIDGRDIADGAGSSGTLDTRGLWAALAWEGAAPWADSLAPGSTPPAERLGGLRLQGNVVHSTSNTTNGGLTPGSGSGNAIGLWADAAWRTERWRNTAGLFRFEPNLRWGTSVLASDLQGVYWQADTATRQWQAGFTTELSDSVSGTGLGTGSGRSAFVNVNGRYRLDTRDSLGAALSLRALTSPGQALQLTWDRASDWGQTQWRGDFANTGGSRTARLGVDQTWPLVRPASFTTSLAWERVAGGAAPSTGWVWGLLGTVSPFAQWSVDASLRGARRSDGAESLNANVGLGWQSFTGWSLSLRYTESRGQEPLSTLVVSALTAASLPVVAATPTSRSVQLLVRYEERAGTATAPLGGLPGTGAGSLSGLVFFDADANGRREATEAGVPGVTVVLDRRFVTRTDAQGRYAFPAVAAGEHLVEISPDNVPLPWSPAQRDPVKTTVLVRQGATQDFAVQRDR